MSAQPFSIVPDKPERYCSFCGKSEHEIDVLVAGPTVFIRDGCVDLCAEIVAKKRAKAATEAFDG